MDKITIAKQPRSVGYVLHKSLRMIIFKYALKF